jgi:hypothetical protein
VTAIPNDLVRYHGSGAPLICELDLQPWRCEFWPLAEVAALNEAYSVEEFAPGYVGFASSGGGELFAFSPSGAIECLPFVPMSPAEALPIAPAWAQFERLLRLNGRGEVDPLHPLGVLRRR